MKTLLFALLFLCSAAFARDPAQVRKFRADNPCPATHSVKGACPGWVVDHIIPLCLGGLDDPRNMQWQDSQASFKKDALEREACRKGCLKKVQ